MFVIQKLQVSHLTRFAMSHEKSDYWPHYIQSRFKQKRAAVEIKWLYGFLLTAKILEIFNNSTWRLEREYLAESCYS